MKKLILIILLAFSPVVASANSFSAPSGKGETSQTFELSDQGASGAYYFTSEDLSLDFIQRWNYILEGDPPIQRPNPSIIPAPATQTLNDWFGAPISDPIGFDSALQRALPNCYANGCAVFSVISENNNCISVSYQDCIELPGFVSLANFQYVGNSPLVENQTSWGLMFTVASIMMGLSILMSVF